MQPGHYNDFLYNKESPIPPNSPLWGQHIKEYGDSKKHLPWGKNIHPDYVRLRDIQDNERLFNPVLQKFRDDQIENQLEENEKKTLRHSISEFYDNQNKFEQAYNIINLKEKFKNFQGLSEEEKRFILPPPFQEYSLRKNLLKPRDYNIVSNYPTNYQPPEPSNDNTNNNNNNIHKLPPCPPPPEEINKKPYYIRSFLYKDFDIISGKYKENNEEKVKVENEIKLIEAAKKMNQRKDYNCLTNRYYNDELTKSYDQKPRWISTKNCSAAIDYKTKNELFNPVNLKVFNEYYLGKKDSDDYHRIDIYRVKSDVEDYYRERDYFKDKMNDNRIINREDYKRYKVEDKRGYDVFTMESTYNKFYDGHHHTKNKYSDWELLKQGVNQNETFSSKKIYIPPYMSEDLDGGYKKFLQERKRMLSGLKPLRDEKMYEKKLRTPKIKIMNKSSSCGNLSKSMPDVMKVNINKNEWFKQKEKDYGMMG